MELLVNIAGFIQSVLVIALFGVTFVLVIISTGLIVTADKAWELIVQFFKSR